MRRRQRRRPTGDDDAKARPAARRRMSSFRFSSQRLLRLAEALDRLLQDRVGGRAAGAPNSTSGSSTATAAQALLVDRLAGRRRGTGRRRPQAAAVRQAHELLHRGAAHACARQRAPRACCRTSAAANSSAAPEVPSFTSTTVGSVIAPSPACGDDGSARRAARLLHGQRAGRRTNSRADGDAGLELAGRRGAATSTTQRRSRRRAQRSATCGRDGAAASGRERGDAHVADARRCRRPVTSGAGRRFARQLDLVRVGGVAADDEQRDLRARRAAQRAACPRTPTCRAWACRRSHG